MFEREILPSPISDEEKKSIKVCIGLAKEKHYALYAGRLVKLKGVDSLIKAWGQCKAPDSWRLLIIGDGNEKVNLNNLVSKLNLDTVDFIPNVSRRNL